METLSEIVQLECESGLIVIAVVGLVCSCKVLEDLLKRGLADAVLLNLHLLLPLLDKAEQESDSLILTRDPELEEVSTLLEKIDPVEHFGQACNEVEAVHLHKAERDESSQSDFALVQARLDEKI